MGELGAAERGSAEHGQTPGGCGGSQTRSRRSEPRGRTRARSGAGSRRRHTAPPCGADPWLQPRLPRRFAGRGDRVREERLRAPSRRRAPASHPQAPSRHRHRASAPQQPRRAVRVRLAGVRGRGRPGGPQVPLRRVPPRAAPAPPVRCVGPRRSGPWRCWCRPRANCSRPFSWDCQDLGVLTVP